MERLGVTTTALLPQLFSMSVWDAERVIEALDTLLASAAFLHCCPLFFLLSLCILWFYVLPTIVLENFVVAPVRKQIHIAGGVFLTSVTSLPQP